MSDGLTARAALSSAGSRRGGDARCRRHLEDTRHPFGRVGKAPFRDRSGDRCVKRCVNFLLRHDLLDPTVGEHL